MAKNTNNSIEDVIPFKNLEESTQTLKLKNKILQELADHNMNAWEWMMMDYLKIAYKDKFN